MNKLLTSLLCLFVVFTLAQAAQDTYKQNPYLGKPDNIGQFNRYSSNLNEVGRKFKNYTALATYSSNGRMSKEDYALMKGTATAPDPYMVTERGGAKATVVHGQYAAGKGTDSIQATFSVDKFTSANDGETLWSRGDMGAGHFKSVKFGNASTSGTAHLISLTGSALRYGGTNNFVGTMGLAENRTVPLGNYGRTSSSGYGIWGYGQNYVYGNAGGHITGAEFDVYEASDAGHYDDLGSNTNKTLSTSAWLAMPDSPHNTTAALGIYAGPVAKFHSGIILTPDSIVPTDVNNKNEAIYINGGSSAPNEYNLFTADGYFKNGLDLSGGIFSGNEILLPQTGDISWKDESTNLTRSRFTVSTDDTTSGMTVVNKSSTVDRYPNFEIRNYMGDTGGFPNVVMRNYGGTITTPLPTPANRIIFNLTGQGYGTTGGLKGAGALSVKSSGTFSDADQPSYWSFELGTTGGNNVLTEVLKVEPSVSTFKHLVHSTSGGFKFPDNTTQATAFSSAPPNAINYYIQLNNGSNGLTYDDGFYYASNKLTAEDLELTTANPTFITDDYTTTGAKTCPSSTIFKGLSDRIPLIAANYYPVMNSGGTAYTAGLQYTNGTGNIIEGSGTYHIAAGTANDGTFRSYYKNGTTAPAAADVRVGGVFGGALDGTTQRISWEVAGFTGSAWTYGSDQPSYVRIATTNDGTATRTEKLRVADNGLLTFSNGGGVPFGSMYTDTSLTVTVSAANTWYEVNTGATDFTAGLLKNVTHSDHYLVATTAGYYQVEACASLGTGVAGHKVALTTAVNGTATSYGHGHSTIANAASTSQVCNINILNLTAGQEVSLVVQNHSGTSNIDIDHAQMKMVYIGSP